VADILSWSRIFLLTVLWVPALLGSGRLVGIGLMVAGLTDFLDGYLARRLGQTTAAGARLDSIADILLLVSAVVWIELLHPEIARENMVLIAATFAVYAASLAVGAVKFHRLGNLHLYSSKVAGGFLYTFALVTLVAGVYEPVLLMLAAAAFILSSAETLVGQLMSELPDERVGSVLIRKRRAETSAIQAINTPRKLRSHAPHSAKLVGSNASATSSRPTAKAPNQNDSKP
jgi:phosphatidylglycerophosphate synthase